MITRPFHCDKSALTALYSISGKKIMSMVGDGVSVCVGMCQCGVIFMALSNHICLRVRCATVHTCVCFCRTYHCELLCVSFKNTPRAKQKTFVSNLGN